MEVFLTSFKNASVAEDPKSRSTCTSWVSQNEAKDSTVKWDCLTLTLVSRNTPAVLSNLPYYEGYIRVHAIDRLSVLMPF